MRQESNQPTFTFKEISSNPEKNWAFWTESAKVSLDMYRQHKGKTGKHPALAQSHKVDFKVRLQKRRDQVHLIKSNLQGVR